MEYLIFDGRYGQPLVNPRFSTPQLRSNVQVLANSTLFLTFTDLFFYQNLFCFCKVMTCNCLDSNGKRVDKRPDKGGLSFKGDFPGSKSFHPDLLIEISNHPLLISFVVQL